MSISLGQTLTAVTAGITSSFGATGGVAPYTYSVLPNGAGGTINSSTGLYKAPTTVPSNPINRYDTIKVVDSTPITPLTTTAKILVGWPVHLLMEILWNQLSIPSNRVYLFDQKIFQFSDSGLYIAVSVLRNKVFGNTRSFDGSLTNSNELQSINIQSTLGIDIMSRSTDALFRKEEVIMALNSDYAESQQEANSFLIGKIPPGAEFTNLSNIDGAAIPYRFHIGCNLQYFVRKTVAVPSYGTFQTVAVTTNP